MADDDGVRALLLDHSDQQAVRNVFEAYTGTGSATLTDYVTAMRATGGDLAVVASDGAADIYACWNGSGGRYEHLTVWPPWSIGGYDHADRAGLESVLDATDDLRVIPHSETPFAEPGTLGSLSHRTELQP
ncbi:uncharacterized protein NP_4428A [Natronomonas pharaonis DSM 2160]|uniref:Uncharacterized protein n=1 Tax=Natronomonas pharaonis (strain ATCC 35678 / DSM 2160 / CIP 103997 / JCM 8858 / NBRC 14720 / NCIMB 2260 / Gabara) TaxID=348780 RepID=A0A1U7EYK6_NATPD|nr:hypothetical protein [Natronomonas pharaonis]CAI50305.1 uncharacterized protein NP_4428A [Natronomonas pharaonis DSM 2160]